MKKPVVLCGVTGGIAACKAADLVSRLHKKDLDVRVLMTPAATRFVQPLTFQAILGKPVATTLFPEPDAAARTEIYPHLYPSNEADLFVVAPATADIIAKLAHGQADDLVSAAALGLSTACLRVFCPAMNTAMWEQPIVRQNVKTLEDHGWIRLGPDAGHLACGTTGPGRMAEPDVLCENLLRLLHQTRELADQHVLILSGPTREHLDPVRFITNSSSGKMGRALADEALRRGATLTFITGPVAPEHLPKAHPERLRLIPVTSAHDMLSAAREAFPSANLAFFAAAVADYTPAESAPAKRPKQSGEIHLLLQSTPDIAATLGTLKQPHQRTIGFALQDHDAHSRAREKLIAKNLDLILLNHLDALHADHADYEALQNGHPDFEPWGRLSKSACAARLFDALATPN